MASRWLLDGPSVLYEKWQIQIDNENYDMSITIEREDRYAGDKFANRREQVILDAAAELAGLHKKLPPEQAPQFAEAVQLLAQSLKSKQEEQNAARATLPSRLPDPQLPSKPLKYMPGRKRALTGMEAAEREEQDRSRARRRLKEARLRDNAEDILAQLEEEKSQQYDDITEDYLARRYTNSPISEHSFQPFDDSDDSFNIDDLLPSPRGPSGLTTNQSEDLSLSSESIV